MCGEPRRDGLERVLEACQFGIRRQIHLHVQLTTSEPRQSAADHVDWADDDLREEHRGDERDENSKE
ncbi:hypothetical protein D3C83_203450 [compost metagenome]